MIEVSNRVLESVLRKTKSGDWDEDLAASTQKTNGRILHHLYMAPSTILLDLEPSAAHLDTKLAFVPEEGILYGLSRLQSL